MDADKWLILKLFKEKCLFSYKPFIIMNLDVLIDNPDRFLLFIQQLLRISITWLQVASREAGSWPNFQDSSGCSAPLFPKHPIYPI